jgi:hypothetical protein
MIELVRFAKQGGPLTKRISLSANGKLINDSSACTMPVGRATRVRIGGLDGLAELIGGLRSHEAISTGRLQTASDHVEVVTKRKLNGQQRPDLIARTRAYVDHQPGAAALVLIDFDRKGMPSAVANKISAAGGLWPALVSVMPELAGVERIERNSTSTGLFNRKTGVRFPGSGGKHVFISVKDGADSERFLTVLHQRCWVSGFGWFMLGAAGQLLERSIVDRMVGQPERLIFEGPPVLVPPLAQDKKSRTPIVHKGQALDTIAACPPLTLVETAILGELRAKAAFALASDVTKAREIFIKKHADILVARTKMEPHLARRVIERQCEGILLPDVILPFDDPELAGVTVADVLADPARFEGETLADPVEGVEYGPGKAKIMRRADGTPWIHSFAHGRTVYELRFDFAAAKKALEGVPANKAAGTFIDLALAADLDPAEIELLRNIAARISGIGRRGLNQMLKAARQEEHRRKTEEAQQQRITARRDPRPQIPAPLPDAPWLPVVASLTQVLKKSAGLEPPARDIEGIITQVRARRVPNMHTLTALGSNDDDGGKETRLPVPEQPLLTRLSEDQLAELIEVHIDFVDPAGRSVHLAPSFVRHFLSQPDDVELPIVCAVATLPVMMPNGALLATPGLARERGIVFRIPKELLEILPKREDCTSGAVVRAMQFLCEEWLCDVTTTYEGKCILIAAALTVIERSLLPDRPTFTVASGRRGSGKTTLLIMLMMALTGARPAAAAWSPNEEERRKALVSYLLQGVPAIVWDNIARGTQISCPHIEKACTAAQMSDRRLGVTEIINVSASTIQFFTGNNIGTRGDLASRNLEVRLEADRPDPENREFQHPDIIGWTEAHRGQILCALYTILIGNPRAVAKQPPAAETRFKHWWHLVGSAVEHAAKQHHAHMKGLAVDTSPACPPQPISFKGIFLSQEDTEEDSASLADALAAIDAQWPESAKFKASDVARLINPLPTDEFGQPKGYRSDQAREHSEILREYLFPTITRNQLVSAKAVGKRLKNHLGEPVRKNGKTLILNSHIDTHAETAVYYVDTK